jgi:N-acetylglucosamine-6-phosphate deacetylase
LRALRLHRAHGTTRSVLSLVTAPIDRLERQLDLIAGLTAADPCVLGSHLEGPFLSSAHKGAHQESLLRAPDHRMIDRLLNAARGSIRQITLAPELPGGMDALHQLTAAGVPVAVGHTDATYEKTREAFEAGATILTHAFSGMNSLHHRAPGPVLAAIRSPAVTLEVINDGVHLHPEIVRLAFDEAPNRIALITDAMAGTGAPDGTYLLGTLEVAVRSGIARLAGGNQIAGSTLTLDVAVANAVRNVGLSFEDAIAAVTEVPARAIGRGHDLGRLAPGYAADAVLMSDEFEVQSVWANGIRIPTGRGLSPAA